ncbi:ferrous iron transport protein A, partial [Escherichia coli]|nr:ferrous iron transport protein A [Escherichia coli]
RLAEHDGELLHWFYEQGLVPGTRLRVLRVDAAAGQMTVALDGEERSIAEKAAAGLYVRVG